MWENVKISIHRWPAFLPWTIVTYDHGYERVGETYFPERPMFSAEIITIDRMNSKRFLCENIDDIRANIEYFCRIDPGVALDDAFAVALKEAAT